MVKDKKDKKSKYKFVKPSISDMVITGIILILIGSFYVNGLINERTEVEFFNKQLDQDPFFYDCYVDSGLTFNKASEMSRLEICDIAAQGGIQQIKENKKQERIDMINSFITKPRYSSLTMFLFSILGFIGGRASWRVFRW